MQRVKNVKQLVKEIDQTILAYYDYSFRIEHEKCMVFIQKLISEMEQLFGYLQTDMQKELENILVRSVEAMDKKDYVLLRDVLYYDLRQFLALLAA